MSKTTALIEKDPHSGKFYITVKYPGAISGDYACMDMNGKLHDYNAYPDHLFSNRKTARDCLRKAKMRMKILEDVKKQLAVVKAKEGVYWTIPPDVLVKGEDVWSVVNKYPKIKTSFRDIVQKHGKECHVCALGSLFLGYVDAVSDVKVSDIGLNISMSEPGKVSISTSAGMKKYLSKYFDEDQLYLIEAVFEGYRSVASVPRSLLPQERLKRIIDQMLLNYGML